MNRLRMSRRWIALIAAYAIALQALLPVALVAAAPAGSPLCSGAAIVVTGTAGGDPIGGTDGTRQGDCCGAMCCAPSFTPPPAAPEIVLRDVRSAPAAVKALRILVLPLVRGPQAPRAPPAA